jgi:hypothetical protein
MIPATARRQRAANEPAHEDHIKTRRRATGVPPHRGNHCRPPAQPSYGRSRPAHRSIEELDALIAGARRLAAASCLARPIPWRAANLPKTYIEKLPPEELGRSAPRSSGSSARERMAANDPTTKRRLADIEIEIGDPDAPPPRVGFSTLGTTLTEQPPCLTMQERRSRPRFRRSLHGSKSRSTLRSRARSCPGPRPRRGRSRPRRKQRRLND